MPDKPDTGDLQQSDQGQKPLITFGIIADIQYADYVPAGTRYYRSSLVKLRESLNSLRRDSADFIITLGDIIDRDYASYKPVLDIIDSSGLKTFHVTGNHDYSVEQGYKKRLPVLHSSNGGYYSFVQLDFRFIFLNGNEISTYASIDKDAIKVAEDHIISLKNNGESNAVEWNGGISSVQLHWLTGQLDEATRKTEKVFIICHFPVAPVNVHNLLNYKEVLTILQKYQNIVAWFNGHNHAGNYDYNNKIHFVTFKGMVESETSNSFALVRVYDNVVQIRGYGREKNQSLKY